MTWRTWLLKPKGHTLREGGSLSELLRLAYGAEPALANSSGTASKTPQFFWVVRVASRKEGRDFRVLLK